MKLFQIPEKGQQHRKSLGHKYISYRYHDIVIDQQMGKKEEKATHIYVRINHAVTQHSTLQIPTNHKSNIEVIQKKLVDWPISSQDPVSCTLKNIKAILIEKQGLHDSERQQMDQFTINDSKCNQEQGKWWKVQGIVEHREHYGQYDVRCYNFEDLKTVYQKKVRYNEFTGKIRHTRRVAI